MQNRKYVTRHLILNSGSSDKTETPGKVYAQSGRHRFHLRFFFFAFLFLCPAIVSHPSSHYTEVVLLFHIIVTFLTHLLIVALVFAFRHPSRHYKPLLHLPFLPETLHLLYYADPCLPTPHYRHQIHTFVRFDR